MIGLKALLDAAGVTHGTALPAALTSGFAIPAFGKLRPICENHWAHFVAEHSLAQGEGLRATAAARADIEREIGRLPW